MPSCQQRHKMNFSILPSRYVPRRAVLPPFAIYGILLSQFIHLTAINGNHTQTISPSPLRSACLISSIQDSFVLSIAKYSPGRYINSIRTVNISVDSVIIRLWNFPHVIKSSTACSIFSVAASSSLNNLFYFKQSEL